MSISVLNTDAGLSGKTIVNLEDAQSISGLKTFQRSPNAPFAVQAGSAVVTNLDADMVDGIHASALGDCSVGDNETITGNWTHSGTTLFSGAVTVSTNPITLSSGKIAFPASQSASADANTLDDYEEGTWTPVIGGSGGTSGQAYSIQVGRYVKIGRLVIAQFVAALSTEGTITTNVQIQGLPFTAENVTNLNSVNSLLFSALATSTWYAMNARVLPNTTVAEVLASAGASSSNSSINLTAADIGNTSRFEGTIIYRADA